MTASLMATREIRVKVAEYAVTAEPILLSTIGLGSCVALTLHDAVAGVGGLAHILLPSVGMSRDRDNRAKFAGTAVPLLVERMAALGARPARMEARIAGGASMFTALVPTSGTPMGERNVIAVRDALVRAGLRLVAQDVGGDHGRSVFFHVGDGQVVVRSLRKGNVVL